VLAVALGLASSLSWGVADFLGGLKSRTLALLTVLALSQACGLLAIALVVAARGDGPPAGGEVVYAGLSAFAGLGGLAAFYRGLAVGAMAVVAPIAGVSAIVPVVFGLLTGEEPAALQGAGIALALAGVALASREESPAGAQAASGVGLALIAALGFGSFFVGMDAASEGDPYWAILVNRITSVSLLALLVLAFRPSLRVSSTDAGTLAAIGVLDMSANGLYAVATTEGLVSVVAVLASLYPVVTIALAHAFLGERTRPSQKLGAAAVLLGVALISAG
jgi:drug/metabolite transporter (DMT)-like permease